MSGTQYYKTCGLVFLEWACRASARGVLRVIMKRRRGRMLKKSEQFALIDSMCGIFKRNPGQLPFAEQMAKWKAEDRELERRRDERLAALFRK